MVVTFNIISVSLSAFIRYVVATMYRLQGTLQTWQRH